MKRSRAAIAVALLAFSGAAGADWQYAKFGMTVDQVIAASDGKARLEPYPGHDQKPGGVLSAKSLARAEYSFNGLDFDVYFAFDVATGGLSLVDLDLKKGGPRYCDDVLRELQAIYGPPETGRSSSIVHQYNWRSDSTGNHVSLLAVGRESCFLNYKPLVRPGAGGL